MATRAGLSCVVVSPIRIHLAALSLGAFLGEELEQLFHDFAQFLARGWPFGGPHLHLDKFLRHSQSALTAPPWPGRGATPVAPGSAGPRRRRWCGNCPYVLDLRYRAI